ncbi:MAG: GGDEF domain-containing protein [Deltaproteobacteria bacterium]|nr:GGDEF domain-containing protein [Deltaproteobacteria bacterium]
MSTNSSPSFFTRLGLYPRDSKEQTVRLRRFFMAAGTYALTFILAFLQSGLGIMEARPLYFLLLVVAVVQTGYYLLFRTGANLRFRDPSLTAPQMYTAALALMYCLYFAGQGRGVYLIMYLIVFLFGVFRFDTKQFLQVTVFSLVTYGLVIYLLVTFKPDTLNLKVELLQWIALAVLLPCFSFIGGYISSLRNNLRKSHTALQEALTKIQEMAIRDDLTGLFNRRHLMNLLDYEKKRTDRVGRLFCLAMLDIDHFKRVNDTLGHQAGDQVLQVVARVIASSLRATDFCGRFGGEEFMLVLIETTGPGAEELAERLRGLVEATTFPDLSPDLNITVSIGITVYQLNEDLSRTIFRADEALYQAKAVGRNAVRLA